MNFAVDDFDVTGHRRFCGVDDSHDSDMADRTVDGLMGMINGVRRSKRRQYCAAADDTLFSISIGEKPEVPDLHKPTWQNVEQESTNELDSVQFHLLNLVALRGVAPLESNDSIVETDEPPVCDGDPVCVAGKVLENVLGSAKGWFSVDDPLPRAQRCDPVFKPQGVLQFTELSVELEASLPESLF